MASGSCELRVVAEDAFSASPVLSASAADTLLSVQGWAGPSIVTRMSSFLLTEQPMAKLESLFHRPARLARKRNTVNVPHLHTDTQTLLGL